MNINRRVGIGVLAAALSACGGQARDVGSNAVDNMGGGGSTATGPSDLPSSPPPTPLPEWPTCDAAGGASAETWTGYVQGASPLSKFGEFTITLQRSGSEACGSLVFGQPVPYPTATDPRIAAPLPVDGTSQLQYLPGFTYTLLDLTITDDRLRFSATSAEPYQSWCALQTSYPNDANSTGFGCLPNLGYHVDGNSCTLSGPGPAISCDQATLCILKLLVCDCNSERCMASFDASPGIYGDFHLTGDTAQGELLGQTSYIKRATTAP